MPRRLRKLLRCLPCLLLWCLAGAAACAHGETKPLAAKEDPATQSIMQSIFQPMSVVLPLSFDAEAFAAPKNQKIIETQLETLAANAQGLETHARHKDRAFEFVAESLARDARNAARWYARGSYDEARFTLRNMTENCIACHSSLPETQEFRGAKRFVEKVDVAHLSKLEQARLQVMSRQFDDALSTYESIFRARDVKPTEVEGLGAFTDYVKLEIGVKDDTKRPLETVDVLLGRSGTPTHVRLQLERWREALREIESTKALKTTDLETPRRLMREARALMEFPRDRDGLMHYVAAEALLSRYVHTHVDRGKDVAEAYYMLGICDGLLGHSLWISRAEFYLESAIRMAPGASFAPKAYALLEDDLVAGYSGSGGTHLPEDEKQSLAELRKLIENAQGKGALKG